MVKLDLASLERSIDGYIERGYEKAIAVNDNLADNPELSGEEYESAKKLCAWLQEEGFEIEKPFCGYETGFRAIKGKQGHRYKVALLAEYDALPGMGHGCGHCTSGVISTLTGIVLSEIQDELDTDIHVIGTPMEEVDGAKVVMTEQGVFEEYDMAIMMHMMPYHSASVRFLAMDGYKYRFHGASAHASAEPWKGHNALNGAQLMMHAVDMLRQHLKPDVRIHAVYSNGGSWPNIVPDYAEIWIYVRAEDRDYLDDVVRQVDACASGAAIATQTEYEKIQDQLPYDNIRENHTGTDKLQELYDRFQLKTEEDEGTGSSDIGNVSRSCPTFHPTFKIVGRDVPVHTKEFADAVKSPQGHEAIRMGSRILAYDIIELVTDSEKMKKMHQEYLESVGKRTKEE